MPAVKSTMVAPTGELSVRRGTKPDLVRDDARGLCDAYQNL